MSQWVTSSFSKPTNCIQNNQLLLLLEFWCWCSFTRYFLSIWFFMICLILSYLPDKNYSIYWNSCQGNGYNIKLIIIERGLSLFIIHSYILPSWLFSTSVRKLLLYGPTGWLSWLSVWLQLRSWSSSLWVWALCGALCWQLGAWSLFQILSVSLLHSCSVSLSLSLSLFLSLKNN